MRLHYLYPISSLINVYKDVKEADCRNLGWVEDLLEDVLHADVQVEANWAEC